VDSYDEIPYDSTPVTETDPDRLAVLGRLFGLDTADPGRCRVLELGSASGGNLIPLAWRYPGSRFIGVELSSRQVAAGQPLIERLGLTNIELVQGDILDLGTDLGTFDYVVVHGVYSWVPADVRSKILQICGSVLKPHGIAYVSYNTLPGWRMRGMLRDMLLYHTRHAASPSERLDRAQGFLDLMLAALARLSAASATYLKEEILRIRKAHPSYLYHEYLAEVNEPCLFRDFLDKAEAHGLAYLCDADLHTLFASTLGTEVEAALGGIEDGIEHEQYLDFVRNRNFRQTLLCRAQVAPGRELDLERFEELAFFADLLPPKRVDLRRPKAQPFRRANGETLEVEHPLTKAALQYLSGRHPDKVPFSALSEAARAAVEGAGGTSHTDELGHLFGELFSLFAHQALGASTEARTFDRPSDRPRATSLALAQAEAGLGHLATPHHATLSLDPLSQRLVSLLDGTRGLDELADTLAREIETGHHALSASPGTERPGSRTRQEVRANCERLIGLLTHHGVLGA